MKKRTVQNQLELNALLKELCTAYVIAKYEIRSPQQGLMLFAFAAAFKTHQAIVTLVEMGLGQDAVKLARTLYEIKLNVKYILATETQERIDRYFKSIHITQERLYNTAVQSNPELKKIVEDREKECRPGDSSIKEIQDLASEAKDNYVGIEQSHWTGKSIEQMANSVGEQPLYDTHYRLASNHIHFNPIIAKEYILVKNQSILFVQKSDEWLIESLLMAYTYLQEILYLCEKVDLFKLGDSLDTLNEKFEGFDDGLVKEQSI